MRPHLCLALAVWVAAALSAAPTALARPTDVSVTAEASPNPVGIEDSLTFTVTLAGSDLGRVPEPLLPQISGAKVLSGPSQSSQTSLSIVNGQWSKSTTLGFAWELLPAAEGPLTIPPVEVRVGGKSYRTDPVRVQVVKGESGAPRGRRRPSADPFDGFFGQEGFPGRNPHARQEVTARDVLVETRADRLRAYVGQAIVLTTRLLVSGSVAQVSDCRLVDGGDLKDFWVEKVDVNPEQTKEGVERDGRQYRSFVIEKKILFPTAAGRFTYGPAIYDVTAQGAGFGFFGSSQQFHPRTEPIAIEVEKLPEEGRPADFSGAVGRFTVEARADKAAATQGEAISYEVTIEGKGNLKTAAEPKLPEDGGFKVFSAKSHDETQAGPDGVEGKKVLTYVLIPGRPGDLEIPRLRFTYFDPEDAQYKVAMPAPVRIAVKPGEEPATASGEPGLAPAVEAKVTRKGEDIRYIKTLSGDPTNEGHPLYREPLFAALVVAPPLANAALFLFAWRGSRRRSDAAAWRARRAGRAALAALKEARKRLASGGGQGFHADLSGALVRYLADRYGVPAISATPGRLVRAMEEKGIDGEAVASIERLLGDCDSARFAPGATSRETMERLYEQALGAIQALEERR